MAFVAGAYTATYEGNDLGITEDGFDIEINYMGEEITGDNLGDTTQDVVFRGGTCFVSCVLEEWDDYLLSLFDNASPGVFGHVGRVGVLGKHTPNFNGGTLILTSTADTASEDSPEFFTGPYAVLAPGFTTRINFNSKLRKIPIRFELLAHPDGTGEFDTTRWFVVN